MKRCSFSIEIHSSSFIISYETNRYVFQIHDLIENLCFVFSAEIKLLLISICVSFRVLQRLCVCQLTAVAGARAGEMSSSCASAPVCVCVSRPRWLVPRFSCRRDILFVCFSACVWVSWPRWLVPRVSCWRDVLFVPEWRSNSRWQVMKPNSARQEMQLSSSITPHCHGKPTQQERQLSSNITPHCHGKPTQQERQLSSSITPHCHGKILPLMGLL